MQQAPAIPIQQGIANLIGSSTTRLRDAETKTEDSWRQGSTENKEKMTGSIGVREAPLTEEAEAGTTEEIMAGRKACQTD